MVIFLYNPYIFSWMQHGYLNPTVFVLDPAIVLKRHCGVVLFIFFLPSYLELFFLYLQKKVRTTSVYMVLWEKKKEEGQDGPVSLTGVPDFFFFLFLPLVAILFIGVEPF